jgi:protocatechuate 3,4-dioxygenase beta subunit
LRAILCVLLAALVHQLPPRDRPATAPVAGATVSGRVFSEATGAPIHGALVVLAGSAVIQSASAWSTGGTLMTTAGRSVETDAAGTFVLAGVEAGEYRLVAKPGLHSGRYLPAGYGAVRANDAGKVVIVRNGDRLQGMDIALPSALGVEGRVIDENGEPLSQMSVVAARLMPGSDDPQRVAHPPATTDDLGRYRIYSLEPGEYLVAVQRQFSVTAASSAAARLPAGSARPEHAGFPMTFHPSAVTQAAAQRIRLAGGRDAVGIDILVTRVHLPNLSGTVLDSRGAPAAGVNGVLGRDGASAFSASHNFYTDADGRFRVLAVEPGLYRLVIGRGGGVNGRAEFADAPITIANDMEDLIVSTQPGVAVSGRVVLADGQPLDTRALRITFARSGPPVRNVETIATMEEERRFRTQDLFGPQFVRLAGLPAGWTLKAVLLGVEDITDVPTAFRGEEDDLQVVISTRVSTLEGQVQDEAGKPVSDATVYVFGADRSAWSMASPRTMKSDAGEQGRFSVTGLAGGRYFAIAILRTGFRPPPALGTAFFELLARDATPFVIAEDERRTLDLRVWRWPE